MPYCFLYIAVFMFKPHSARSHAKSTMLGSVVRLTCLLVLAGFSSVAISATDNSTIDIHTKTSKKFVGRIAATNEPEQIRIEGSWQIVAFSKPAVPLWSTLR